MARRDELWRNFKSFESSIGNNVPLKIADKVEFTDGLAELMDLEIQAERHFIRAELDLMSLGDNDKTAMDNLKRGFSCQIRAAAMTRAQNDIGTELKEWVAYIFYDGMAMLADLEGADNARQYYNLVRFLREPDTGPVDLWPFLGRSNRHMGGREED